MADSRLRFEVVSGCEGPSLYISTDGGETRTRIAGPKPWGGGKTKYVFRVPEHALDDIEAAIKEASDERTRCEGCGEPADGFDQNDVPLCAACAGAASGGSDLSVVVRDPPKKSRKKGATRA